MAKTDLSTKVKPPSRMCVCFVCACVCVGLASVQDVEWSCSACGHVDLKRHSSSVCNDKHNLM